MIAAALAGGAYCRRRRGVVERASTTIWLPPGTRATLGRDGNLAIDLEA